MLSWSLAALSIMVFGYIVLYHSDISMREGLPTKADVLMVPDCHSPGSRGDAAWDGKRTGNRNMRFSSLCPLRTIPAAKPRAGI